MTKSLDDLKQRLEKLTKDRARKSHDGIDDQLAVKWEFVAAYTEGATMMQAELFPLLERAVEMAEKIKQHSHMPTGYEFVGHQDKARAFLESLK